jgi:transposase-like protein
MSASILSAPYFHNEESAYEFVQSRLWPDNKPVCPFCGTQDRVGKLAGKSTRIGVHKCYECRKPFTIKVGTIFESSHIPLRLWLQAIFLIASSKKGISSNQLHRTLGVTLKSAWFMSHRVREAMREGKLGPLGGEGKTVEADETFIGGKEKNKHRNKRNAGNIGGQGKEIVFSLVERGGAVRSEHVREVSGETLAPILREQLKQETTLMTDEAGQYRNVGKEFARHQAVNHGIGEYVRGNAHTNTIEGYFSILKRGIVGTYHHVSAKHLKRYLAEFDFRYNNRVKLGVDDKQRAELLLQGVVGKRLTYQTTSPQ